MTHSAYATPCLVLTAVALACGLVATPVGADNLVYNGDFESGNVGFATDYLFSPGNIWNPRTYDVVTDPRLSHPSATSYGDHTTGSGLMMVANGATTGGALVWSQSYPVIPGSQYTFSLWISSWFAGSPAQLDLRFNGVSVGIFSAPSSTAQWERFETTWDSGADTSLAVSIFDRTTLYGGNDFALDDISTVYAGPSSGIAQPEALASTCIRAFPNPTAASVRLVIVDLPSTARRIDIYSVGGTLIRSLTVSRLKTERETVFSWDGRTQMGLPAAPGIYLAQVSGYPTIAGKIILVH